MLSLKIGEEPACGRPPEQLGRCGIWGSGAAGVISPVLSFPSCTCFWTVTHMQELSYTCGAALDVYKQDLKKVKAPLGKSVF